MVTIKQWFAILTCELFGHRLIHRQRSMYRDGVNFCGRCQSPVYVRGLKAE